jgi:DNA-binding HxlR family transcriptional regulator
MNPRLNNTACVASLKLLGDFWTLRIIDALKEGGLRYCELQRRVDGINPVTLAARLKKLEAAKLIQRDECTLDKISVSYQLTDRGRDALPVIAAVDRFTAQSVG